MDDAAQANGPQGFTSLDDSETFVQNLLTCTEAQEHIHRATQEIRTSLILAFALHGEDGLMKRANRLADCCKWPLLLLRNDGKPAISLQRCRDRLCPVCSKIKGMQTTARVQEAVKQMNSKRFVTLTGQSANKTLKEASTQITTAFRELRRSKLWKQHVNSGIWTKEIKPGKVEGTWNVHLHMIIDGKYFPQKDLSEAWLKATGDSMIVDIRKIHDDKGAASYVTKYIAKPGNFSRWSEAEIVNFAIATKGDRLLGTFGKLHSMVKLDEEKPESEQLSGKTISAYKLLQLASEDVPAARTAVELLARCGGFYAACVAASPTQQREKTSDSDLASLGQAIGECIAVLALRETPQISETEIEIPPECNVETWNQLTLLDTSRGSAYL